jgi:hypothetical protein
VATPKTFVVPRAALIATGKFTPSQAASALREASSLKRLMERALGSDGDN